MRALQTLSVAGTTQLNLGDMEFVDAGTRVFVAGHDSVATATLSLTLGGANVFSGPLAIEPGTDVAPEYNGQGALTYFTANKRAQLIATLGGTVAGARVNFLYVSPNEVLPW